MISNQTQKVLITGSCGFVLSNLVRKIIYGKHPYDVVSIDKVNSHSTNSMYWNKNHTFHIADCCDQHIIDTIFKFEQPDIVIHGAANTGVDRSFWDSNTFVNSNVLGTQTIINACLDHKVKKLIYISTDGVYGELTDEVQAPWTEESPTNPRNPYAATKLAGEPLVKAAHHARGLIYNIVRLSNSYGPYQTTEKLIPLTIKSLLEGATVPIYGQGRQIRSWTHAFDVNQGLITVLSQGVPNEPYNLSANQEMPNIVVVQKICSIMSKDIGTVFYSPKTGHDFRRATNTDKLRQLGWAHGYKFKNGIVDTVNWYLDNKWILK